MSCITKIAALALLLIVTSLPANAADGEKRYIEVRGTYLYVETFGDGRPILFLHGGMTSFDDAFVHQHEDFAASRKVIGIDQRGHGHSPDGEWDLSYKMMAADTAAVLETLGLGPVDVIGHSDGANIALILARDYPRLVRRVVVSGANLRSGLTPQQASALRSLSSVDLAAKLEATSEKIPARFKAAYGRVSPDGPEHWMTLLRKCFYMWIEPVVLDFGDLAKIDAPVLVMAGEHDFTSIEDTLEIYRGLPHGQIMLVPGTGHDTMGLRYQLVDLAIRDFIDAPDDAPRAH